MKMSRLDTITMELLLLIAIFSYQGNCVYLRIQELQKNISISDIKKGTEVISLKPLSYLQEELEPRNRADYFLKDDKCNRPPNCILVVDSEGRVLFNKLPPVNTTVVAITKVSFQGVTSSTTIKLRIVDDRPTSRQCPPPTEEDCFRTNYTFRITQQKYSSNKDILLGRFGPPGDCYRAQYSLSRRNKQTLAKIFKLDGDALYFSGNSDGIKLTDIKIKCSISLADAKDNSSRKALISIFRDFSVNVLSSPSLPYPSSGHTRTILISNNTFNKGSSLLLAWFWLPEDSTYISRQENKAFNLPINTQLWIDSVASNTFNLRSNLLLIYLNWTRADTLQNNVTSSITIPVTKKLPMMPTLQGTTEEIKLTVVLKVNETIPRVSYTKDVLIASEHLPPFSQLALHPDVRELSNTTVAFRSGMPPFVQTPYDVTERGGIVYLKDWGPQAFPCQGTCAKVFIVEWTKSGYDFERRVILGAKVFRVIEEKKSSGVMRCKDQGKSEMHWNFCSKHDDAKTCNKACGLGAYNGVQSHCSWREAKLNLRSTSSPQEVVPTPNLGDLTKEYATCRSDPRSCPDHWCDPLERLHPTICPQDCANDVAGGNLNVETNLGIYSSSAQSICTCSDTLMCHCGPPTLRAIKEPGAKKGSVELKTDYVSLKNATPPPTSHQEYEPLKTDTVNCDVGCKAAITVSSCILILLVSVLVFVRRRSCLGIGKMKVTGTEDGNLSIDPLVPLQTLSTSPTTITESPLEHTCEIDVKWEVPRSRVEVLETLGEGEFGKVLKARAKDLPSKQGLTVVAVKTLKENAGSLELNDLMSEYQLLKEVNHPNVIKLLGACTTSDGPIYIIIEYCSLGSLRNYLRKTRNAKAHECLEAGSIEVTPKDILSFSWQICKGMAYLAEMKMVHRDLATRNILLAENKKCKISDFGMTRDVYVDDTYLKVSRSRVPVKWMALESLREHVYTSKSDVWSMGIVLWELVTLGASPYPGIPAEKLYGLLTSGYRMPRPTNCSNKLYEIMRECWAKEPYRRPTFQQLVNKFESMLGEEIEYLNCNINAFSNPAYFNNKPNTSMNNLDIRFSMSLDDLKSFDKKGSYNTYENERNECMPSFNYDVPKPQSNIYVQNMKIKDKIIDEKVDNR